ncbi:MAG: DUF4142 domain-containing protein [Chamaesiphon sp.]
MMLKKTTITTIVLASGVFPLLGQIALAQPMQSPTRVSTSDRQFMLEAARGGMTEVTLGELASERAVSNDVKQFGQQMVQDHTKANNQLMQLAAQKRVNLPKGMDAEHKVFRARIGQISGTRFDRIYMRQMVTDHQNTLSLFQREARQGRDRDLKAFAAKTVPTIQEHLQMSRQLTTARNSMQSQSK